MTEVVHGAALAVTGAGVLAALAVASQAGLRAGLPVLLDFLLAAGLLRLTVALGWEELLTVALVVAVRHLAMAGLGAHARHSERAPHYGGPPARPGRPR